MSPGEPVSSGLRSVGNKHKSLGPRHIPSSMWNKHREEIEVLYVHAEPRMQLARLVKHMRVEHDFVATEKQYKAQLTKWDTKKNLSVPDAAIILHLIDEAQARGIRREVLFNGREKTREDMLCYIKKSSRVGSEADLLSHLPHDPDWPPNIRWHDDMLFPADGVGAFEVIRPFVQSQGDSDLTATSSKSVSYDLVSEVFGGPEIMFGQGSGIGSSLAGGTKEKRQQHVGWAEEDIFYSENTFAAFDDLMAPLGITTTADSFMMIDHKPNAELDRFNNFMSLTSKTFDEASGVDSKSLWEGLEAQVDKMLGKHPDSYACESPDCSQQFLRCACEASIYDGQTQDERFDLQATGQAWQAVASAGKAFLQLVDTIPDCSLSVLNSMVYVLAMYGQMDMAIKILKHLKTCTNEHIDPQIMALVSNTLDFMISIPEPGTGALPYYDLKMLQHTVDISSSLKSPRLLLAAKYNLAWALLEMQRPREAADILVHIMPDCEEVFGPHHIQTIVYISTLARAYLFSDRPVAGERLIHEVMGPRIEKAYSTSHPMYWESRNREALFMRFRAKSMPDKDGAYRREESELLLRQVLQWRVSNLGPNNPQTKRTYTVLRNFYIQSGRDEEVRQLHAMLTEDA